MIFNEVKQQLVSNAVNYFKDLKNTVRDEMSYELLEILFTGQQYKSELDTAGALLAATAIVHNIQRKNKDTGVWELRPEKDCYSGLITFVQANRLEKFTVTFSHAKQQIDLASMRVLDQLKFFNTNHDYLTAGMGKKEPDLIDCNNDITYEVKANYKKNGSVSGFHGAKRLVDCEGTHIIIYPILYNDIVDFNNKLFHFRNVIPGHLLEFPVAISDELLTIIKSGELIPEVEKCLDEVSFEWNP